MASGQDTRIPRQLAFQLAALSALGPFCIDAYLPCMPEIGASFGVNLEAVQQTLTAYLLPFAVMTLWHGALSDAFGRRRVVLVLLLLFTLASIGCALAPNHPSLVLFRALQGLTAGAGMVIGRAIIRDVMEGPGAQRMMSVVAIIFAVAPAVAPVIGGWLHHWFGWRSVFVFMVLYAAGVLGWCWASLPESLRPEKRQPFHPGYLARAYWNVWTSVPFVATCFAVSAAFGGFFIYVLSAPVFLMRHLHATETGFLWLFGPATAGMVIGAFLSGRMAGRIRPLKTAIIGCTVMAAAALITLGVNLTIGAGLPWSVLPFFFYNMGMAVSMPSLTLLGLDLFPERRGLAASCQSFVQSSTNALLSLAAPVVWGSTVTLGATQIACVALCALCVASHAIAIRRRGTSASL